jgi:hypothetical protein
MTIGNLARRIDRSVLLKYPIIWSTAGHFVVPVAVAIVACVVPFACCLYPVNNHSIPDSDVVFWASVTIVLLIALAWLGYVSRALMLPYLDPGPLHCRRLTCLLLVVISVISFPWLLAPSLAYRIRSTVDRPRFVLAYFKTCVLCDLAFAINIDDNTKSVGDSLQQLGRELDDDMTKKFGQSLSADDIRSICAKYPPLTVGNVRDELAGSFSQRYYLRELAWTKVLGYSVAKRTLEIQIRDLRAIIDSQFAEYRDVSTADAIDDMRQVARRLEAARKAGVVTGGYDGHWDVALTLFCLSCGAALAVNMRPLVTHDALLGVALAGTLPLVIWILARNEVDRAPYVYESLLACNGAYWLLWLVFIIFPRAAVDFEAFWLVAMPPMTCLLSIQVLESLESLKLIGIGWRVYGLLGCGAALLGLPLLVSWSIDLCWRPKLSAWEGTVEPNEGLGRK